MHTFIKKHLFCSVFVITSMVLLATILPTSMQSKSNTNVVMASSEPTKKPTTVKQTNQNYNISFTKKSTKKLKKYKSLGVLKVSHFCGCRKCNGKYYGMPTAAGTKMVEGRTIAVDAKNPIVPLGTKLLINGQIYTAEDTGNLNAHGRQLDIYVKSHKECYRLGVKSYQVKVVK